MRRTLGSFTEDAGPARRGSRSSWHRHPAPGTSEHCYLFIEIHFSPFPFRFPLKNEVVHSRADVETDEMETFFPQGGSLSRSCGVNHSRPPVRFPWTLHYGGHLHPSCPGPLPALGLSLSGLLLPSNVQSDSLSRRVYRSPPLPGWKGRAVMRGFVYLTRSGGLSTCGGALFNTYPLKNDCMNERTNEFFSPVRD